MLEIHPAIGPGNWLSGGDAIARRAAMRGLFIDYAERPDQLLEDWPEGRALHAEMVVVSGDKLVGTGMLVVDRDRADCPARIWGMAFDPQYRTDFLVFSLEEALLKDGAFEIDHEFIEGADGRLVPNPYADFDSLFSNLPTFEA